MANALYDKGRQKFLEGGIAWLTDTIKVVLVDTALYTPDLANDEFLDDIPAGARIATSAAITGKTSTAGVADADNTPYSTVTGATVEAAVFYKDTGTEATSALIAYIDTATGLPFTPSGGDVEIRWSGAATKIFKL
jgi:hypothetical protein